MQLSDLLKTPGTRIIDVRTPGEFAAGHVAGSINIPLNEVPARVNEFRSEAPVILCCQSGNRSGQAANFLLSNGLENIHNGGGWLDVNYASSL